MLSGSEVLAGAQPWDLGPITAREVPGVLGIFDADSVAVADDLLGSVQNGRWPRVSRAGAARAGTASAVVYAPSDPHRSSSPWTTCRAVIRQLSDARRHRGSTRGTAGRQPDRAQPRLLRDQPGPDRDRLLRHEVTHVAVGVLSDHVPAWLAEGIAEYVSVQPVPPDRRGVTQEAIDLARAKAVRLPDDDGFDGNRSAANYAIAWWACEAIARSYGEATLWSLLAAYDGGDDDAQVGPRHRARAARAGHGAAAGAAVRLSHTTRTRVPTPAKSQSLRDIPAESRMQPCDSPMFVPSSQSAWICSPTTAGDPVEADAAGLPAGRSWRA